MTVSLVPQQSPADTQGAAGTDLAVAEPAHPWMVITRQQGATAGVTVTPEGLLVMVSEATDGHAGTMARLYPDGRVTVQCVGAPQAILVPMLAEPALVPSLPGMADDLTLAGDDVLVMCSAGVLDYLPRGLGYVVPRIRNDEDPTLLLAEVLAYAKCGAGAIIRRLPSD